MKAALSPDLDALVKIVMAPAPLPEGACTACRGRGGRMHLLGVNGGMTWVGCSRCGSSGKEPS